MDREMRIESSLSVQSRVSVVSLAQLVSYWERSGVSVKTMSQLVSWSLDLMCEVLRNNGEMRDEVESIGQAYSMLEIRGLFQKSLKQRSIRKISTALGFEALRQDGVEPKDYAEKVYRSIHEKKRGPIIDDIEDAIRKAREINAPKEDTEEEKQARLNKIDEALKWNETISVAKAEALKNVRESGKLHEQVEQVEMKKSAKDSEARKLTLEEIEENLKRQVEKDKEVREKENAPIDAEFLRNKIVQK